jgi:hypothetical protein
VNSLPRQSNQNRMIPVALSPKLLGVKHAAYCTIVSPLSQHTIFAPTPIETPVDTLTLRQMRFLGSELSDAECRRESRQTLTGSTLIPEGTEEVEDYSEFLICGVEDSWVSSVRVYAKKRSVGEAGRWREKLGAGGVL